MQSLFVIIVLIFAVQAFAQEPALDLQDSLYANTNKVGHVDAGINAADMLI